MKYIDVIKLPSQESINNYFAGLNHYLYPWTIFFQNGFEWVNCKDITIFYGNNGSGKSTLLNLIAEKISAHRGHEFFKDVIYNDYSNEVHPFDDFLAEIDIKMSYDDYGEKTVLPKTRRIITGEDIFKKIDTKSNYNRTALEKINNIRERQQSLKNQSARLTSLNEFDEFLKIIEAKKLSKAKYARIHGPVKETMKSNGETAIEYFQKAFESNGIYLLDEPENCLSPSFQLELINMIQEMSSYFSCQFFICTHSPFILSLKNSVIYNLDSEPVIPQNWEELENVKIYYEFFKTNEAKFKK